MKRRNRFLAGSRAWLQAAWDRALLPLVRGSTETADEEIPNFPDAVVSEKTVLCE